MDYSPLKIVGSAYILRVFWSHKTLMARLAVLSDRNDGESEDDVYLDCIVQDPQIFQWLIGCYADLQQNTNIRIDFVAEYLAFTSRFSDTDSNHLTFKAKLVSAREAFRQVEPKRLVA
jgi:hypothetical protein